MKRYSPSETSKGNTSFWNDEPAEKTVETEVGGVKLTITNEVPEDSKPEAEQLTLF